MHVTAKALLMHQLTRLEELDVARFETPAILKKLRLVVVVWRS